ncbi:type VI secretion system baseplate subunit TssG [Vibrio paucivorans]
MGNSDWNAAADLSARDEAEGRIEQTDIREYSFYPLVELLLKQKGIEPEAELWERDCDLVFSANPSLGFSPADIHSLSSSEQRMLLETNFFGLTGSQSPLPGFILEQLVNEEEGGMKRPFLDFFNNRLINLVYRIWRKYRYYIRFSEGAEDQFSAQLFALVGLADPHLRGETPINWCKMLAYSGVLAGRSRSPSVVAGIISHCFELPDVTIKQWVQRKVLIDEQQKMALGLQNGSLGCDTVIGDSVTDVNGKFTVCIGGLTKERFSDFLPSGKEYQPLCKLVEFILREQMAYDIELKMLEEQTPTMSFNKNSAVALGWTSFLGQGPDEQSVTIQVRQ